MATVLVCDAGGATWESLNRALSERGHQVGRATSASEILPHVKCLQPDLLILDFDVAMGDGPDVLRLVYQSFPRQLVIVITTRDDMDTVIQATRLGVYDVLSQPIDTETLENAIRRALDYNDTRKRGDHIAVAESAPCQAGYHLVGKSPQLRKICQHVGKIADHPVTVLIEGESGTGKELLAKVIHHSGANAKHPFIGVNCGALAEGLLESELFGHVRGSFTGAVSNKKGKFELAGKGTIFLDEISETSPAMQVKLLRVLQEKEFDPVGSEQSLKQQARVIASTNHNLEALVEANRFRRDLFYRLNIYTIRIPPLRERREDIEELVLHFLTRFRKQYGVAITGIARNAMKRLCSYHWPGNVRQLEHVLLNAIMHRSGEILNEAAISFPDNDENLHDQLQEEAEMTLSQIERQHIERVLRRVAWNKVEACRLLQISKPTLYSKIRQYGIHNGHVT